MMFGVPRPHKAERIAITGMGVVSPIGQGVGAFWSSLIGGVSGISDIERFDASDMRVRRGGEIKRLAEPPEGAQLPSCRASQFLICAALEAMHQANLKPAPGLGVVIGSALGGMGEAERFQADRRDLRALDGASYDGPTRRLARWLGADGPALSLSTACASGATSLGIGADLLQAGAATAVLAGGVDALCRFVMQGFNRMRSLTRDEVRPFDRRRSGLLLGEGAGVVVLEREAAVRRRGAEPIGWLRGHASCADGSHITAPDDEGGGLEHAVRLAMRYAGVKPEAIEFISAHGTGTPSNDRVETRVFKRVLGPRAYAAPINSIKAHMGHTMGAAAILETIMCLLCWRHGRIPPTLNYREPDPECDLDYTPETARALRPRISLKTAAGFAGCNACLILEGA